MIWQELSVVTPREFVEPISYLFGRYGHGVSMEEAGPDLVLLRTYLPSTSKRRRARIEVGVNLVRSVQPMAELAVKELEDADWENAWKVHFTLLKIGSTLVIKPSWIGYQPEPHEVVIELDPGMAFGTGYHPTTRMCLEALEGHLRPGMGVLDLGTGSGILSIAAVRLGAGSAVALDLDSTAVTAARKNFKAGGIKRMVRLARGTLPNHLAPGRSFDLAVANISSRVVKQQAEHLHAAIKPGGTLVVSGFIRSQSEELEAVLTGIGFRRTQVYGIEDWVALSFTREA